ncbi:MAG: hypothetical protein KatS3mg014_0835 [Actinomycetota bacterium]|nr:MAG: hypothetical protein KatS3mg014_0835 [Actinomycetota bacterium]
MGTAWRAELTVSLANGTFSVPFEDCGDPFDCRALEGSDVNHDLRAELPIVLGPGAAVSYVGMYRVEPGTVRALELAPPGDAGYLEPGPIRLGGAHDAIRQTGFECRDVGARRVLVAWSAERGRRRLALAAPRDLPRAARGRLRRDRDRGPRGRHGPPARVGHLPVAAAGRRGAGSGSVRGRMGGVFTIARNPQEDSSLPYLLRLPIEGGLVLKARDTWPRSSRVYCHPYEEGWPADAEIVEETPVVSCRRRGAVIDLVLDRPRLARSQFVFTETRGRPAIFWQTRKAARAANPGARIPRARALREGLLIVVDTRERYPYRFAGRGVTTERLALPAGDYAVVAEGDPIATVERKTLENLAASLSDGTLAFQMQRLAEIPSAAVVVEGRYPQLFGLEHVSGAWLADMLARLQLRYPEVPIVFADSRRFAEEWTYRFLAAALAEAPPEPEPDDVEGDADVS